MAPRKIIAGAGSASRWVDEALAAGCRKVAVLSTDPIWSFLEASLEEASRKGLETFRIDYRLKGEPTSDYFEQLRAQAAALEPDGIVGVGGGSVLDIAKLLAALSGTSTPVSECFGNGLVKERALALICLPTTSGTGSEVSPNAILLDSADGEKKGVISPRLLPDCTITDPCLTLSLPPRLTAETGFDALCHCVEAFINIHAHPIVDTYALRGVEMVCKYLERACKDGSDVQAREGMSIASMMGGLCLGPVNTCGVHALSYGLAGKYHLPHGLANALLLPEVLRFNAEACPERIAALAGAAGIAPSGNPQKDADAVIRAFAALSGRIGIPQHLSEVGVRAEDIPEMATMALNVTRLLSNNPREMTRPDIEGIYTNIL